MGRVVVGLAVVVLGICVALPTEVIPRIAVGVVLVWIGVVIITFGEPRA